MYNGGGDGYGNHDGGGVSQFAGGGFMTSPPGHAVGENGGTSFSPNSGGRRGGGGQSAGVVPVTIRQIATAEKSDDNLIIDGQSLVNVTLVGRVATKSVQSVKAEFTIDDGTGSITVSHWLNDETEDRDNVSSIQLNTYVRVYGHFRHFDGKVLVQLFSIRPIVDFNEITAHGLECIFVHLCNVKAQGGSIPAASAGTAHNPAGFVTPSKPSGPGATPAASSNHYSNQYAAPAAVTSGGSLKDLNGMVQSIFDDPANLPLEAGLSWQEVVQRVPGYSTQQVREAIEFLVNEGHLYSTIDDNHFKSTGIVG